MIFKPINGLSHFFLPLALPLNILLNLPHPQSPLLYIRDIWNCLLVTKPAALFLDSGHTLLYPIDSALRSAYALFIFVFIASYISLAWFQ